MTASTGLRFGWEFFIHLHHVLFIDGRGSAATPKKTLHMVAIAAMTGTSHARQMS
jgi:hypothetical protein